MDIKKLIEGLHVLERKVLPLIPKVKSFDELVEKSGLQPVEVMRALQWLQNKKIILVKEKIKKIVELDVNGIQYAKSKLPERRFFEAMTDKFQEIQSIVKKAKIKKDEFNVCLGLLRSKAAIEIAKKDEKLYAKKGPGAKVFEKETLEEKFLHKKFPVELKSLKDEEKFAYNNLKKRKGIIKTKILKLKNIQLVLLGKYILKKGIKQGNIIDRLTPALLKTGKWKGKTFRRYDVKINVPQIYGGKEHFVKKTIEHAKKIWLEMGFEEMKGPIVESEFWTFDTLFVPQDHPAREMQDTFFLKGKASLPDEKLVNYVKRAHEKGVDNSKGWGYNYSEEQAKQIVLRPHTTGASARTLACLKLKDLPKKFFIVGRNYRNETLDWSHLFEFNQTDGIVVDENVSFRDLLGYLKEFFKKMGFEKARFRPAHFPYTEPSVEIDVYHPVHKKWIELGGAGIFRPELTEPLLGKPIPVLAWGLGLARLIALTYDLKDVRDLYANDIKQLRNIKCLQ